MSSPVNDYFFSKLLILKRRLEPAVRWVTGISESRNKVRESGCFGRTNQNCCSSRWSEVSDPSVSFSAEAATASTSHRLQLGFHLSVSVKFGSTETDGRIESHPVRILYESTCIRRKCPARKNILPKIPQLQIPNRYFNNYYHCHFKLYYFSCNYCK